MGLNMKIIDEIVKDYVGDDVTKIDRISEEANQEAKDTIFAISIICLFVIGLSFTICILCTDEIPQYEDLDKVLNDLKMIIVFILTFFIGLTIGMVVKITELSDRLKQDKKYIEYYLKRVEEENK